MRIKMKAQISGTRNGEDWPSRGELVDLPDEEAVNLITAGMAEPASQAESKKVDKFNEDRSGDRYHDDPQMSQYATRADQPPERHPVEATVVDNTPRGHPSLGDVGTSRRDRADGRGRDGAGDPVTTRGLMAEAPQVVEGGTSEHKSMLVNKGKDDDYDGGSDVAGDVAATKDKDASKDELGSAARTPVTTRTGPVKK